eukprot:TRINITY_DN604_c0_g1_i1.p1 TRINITY_DN604_c0_g1~~TRINITY_DN604_c0_g1_i1.p1  ORF type:complete len:1064 (-),score=338.27 TRINITY_DN604_c0_g1_i1:106-3297(-)
MGKSKGSKSADLNEVVLDAYSDEFPLSTTALSKLVDPKDPEYLKELGGLEGVASSLRANIKTGLAHEHNDTEEHRIAKYGKNVLPPPPRKTLLSIVWDALGDQVLRILIVASVIAIILGALPQTAEDPQLDWIEGVAILIAVVIVVSVTSINDFQKQKQFEKLNDKKNDREVKAIRGGEQCLLSIFDVRVGDIIVLDTGDIVCADGIFIEGHSIKTDESAMTGEADAIKKGSLADGMDPFFLSGSQVIEGFGRMLVIAVGKYSFNGKTMLALQVEDSDTPLQEKLTHLANNIGKFGLGAAALLLLIAIPKYLIIHRDTLDSKVATVIVRYIINAITIVVVAVPEGLPLAVTMALAYGMIKMLKLNNLVRHLDACETMADATNICSDKTGTLTTNQMTVVTGWVAGRLYEENNFAQADGELQGFTRQVLCDGIAVNSNAFEGPNAKGKIDFIGSKTECAMLMWTKSLGSNYDTIRRDLAVKQLYPFSSARKRMSTLVTLSDGSASAKEMNLEIGGASSHSGGPKYRIFTKGASEIVAGMCDRVLGRDGVPVPFSDAARREVDQTILHFASDALRTIGIAYADFDEERDWEIPPENNLVLIGIVGIRDPIRPEVPPAVATCQRAGITVRMVTGDNIVTAENIARKCGILTEGGICMEGPKFRELSTDQMDRILPNLQVLARSSPTDKQILVERLQALGEVVAVTGDGTNDGPALKMADIGFSMGVSGTEVAIAASDVVLLDDNFASIVVAVLWGRNIFDAIRKFLQFQLTVNVVAVTIALIGSLTTDKHSPLGAVQLLWVNLIMDTMAALALATEPPTPDLLLREPNSRAEGLINRRMWRNILVQSVYQLIVCFVILYAGDKIWTYIVKDSRHHYTLLFNTFVFMQLFNEINSRELENRINVFRGLHKSYLFMIVIVLTLAIQVVFVQLGDRFTQTDPLAWYEWFECVAIGAFCMVIGVFQRMLPIHNKVYPRQLHMIKVTDETGQRSSIIMTPVVQPNDTKSIDDDHQQSELLIVRAAPPSPGLGRGWQIARQTRTKIAVVNAFKSSSMADDLVASVHGGRHRH